MVTNNAVNLSQSGIVRYDGAGTFTGEPLTLHSLLAGDASNHIFNVGVATDGQLPIGKTGDFPQLAGLTGGTGISVTNGPGSITISSTGGGIFWNDVTGTSASASANNGYLADNASLVTITLPVTCAQFGVIAVAGFGAGGWKIAQNSGQNIQIGQIGTTSGVAGFLASTNRYDVVYMLCVVANTTFLVLDSMGNITVN